MGLFRSDRRTVTTRPVARRKRRRRALVALGVTTALIAGATYGTWQYIDENEYLLDERCELAVGEDDYELSPTHMHHAALLSTAAVDRSLPLEAAMHAVAVSLQETELSLRDSGDQLGDHELFARGAPDWTAESEVQRTAVTITEFFDVLEDSWTSGLEAAEGDDDDDAEDSSEPEQTFWSPELDLEEAAEILQRPHNAQFYPRHSSQARALARPLSGQTSGPDMTCHLSQLNVPGPDPQGVVNELVAMLPNALQIPFTEPPEDEENGDDDDENAEEFAPEPILDGIIEVTEVEDEPVVYVTPPSPDNDQEQHYNYQWMLAHWAVAAAEDHGIQSVTSAPYRWDRDSAQWQRLSEDGTAATTEGTVLIGFTRDRDR